MPPVSDGRRIEGSSLAMVRCAAPSAWDAPRPDIRVSDGALQHEAGSQRMIGGLTTASSVSDGAPVTLLRQGRTVRLE
jgi:hypothetical protein